MAHITRTNSNPGLTPPQQPIAPSYPFSPAFLGKAGLDISATETFSQNTFQELIAESHRAGLPYYVAATKDFGKQIEFFDAASLMRAYYKFKEIISPLNRQPFEEIKIYECKPGQKSFVEFCDFYQLLDDDLHYAKYLLASDLLDTPADVRGECRYYLGGYCEFKLGDLKQAEFWYTKAAEDNYVLAHFALAEWFEKGVYNHPKSTSKAIEEYEIALALIETSPDAEFAHLAKQIIEKIDVLRLTRSIEMLSLSSSGSDPSASVLQN